MDLWTTSLLPTGSTVPSREYVDIIPDDHISGKRVARLMRAAVLQGVSRRKVRAQ